MLNPLGKFNSSTTNEISYPHYSKIKRIYNTLNENITFTLTLFLLLVLVIVAIFAAWLSPYDPLLVVGQEYLWPGADTLHPLGTDALGRDELAGILYGARISLFVGLTATLLGLSIGVSLGAISGYFGGVVDDIIVRIIEIFQTIPHFVLLIVVVAVLPPSIWSVVFGIALVSWDFMARLTRAEFRSLTSKEFVLAAKSEGYRHSKIIVSEILPNAFPSIIAGASVMVANAILMESALSFMGLGDPNSISWGSMIGSGREVLRTHWYLTAIPGAFIVITVLTLNLFADHVTDIMNPKRKKTKATVVKKIKVNR